MDVGEKTACASSKTELQTLQEVQLDLLREFMQVCDGHGLRYCAVFGTLLGAVRNGGLIHWDDDIDMAMPREDYEKLRDVCFRAPYFLQTPSSDPDTYTIYFRLCNDDTLCAKQIDMVHGHNKGCHIDILPIDRLAGGEKRWRKLHRKVRQLRRLIENKARWQGIYSRIIPEENQVLLQLAGDSSLADMYTRANKICASAGRGDSPQAGILGTRRFCVMPAADFFPAVPLSFGPFTLPAPGGYETFLHTVYDGDLSLPEVEARLPRHAVSLLDTRKSWRVYAAHFEDIFEKIRGRQVLLFGAGAVAKTFLEAYDGDYTVVALADNDQNKWGKPLLGLPVLPPGALPGHVARGVVILIASIYFVEIGRQLEEMGIDDYMIYFDGKKYDA